MHASTTIPLGSVYTHRHQQQQLRHHQQQNYASPLNLVRTLSSSRRRKDDINMSINAVKIKSLWASFFQAQNNSPLVQKSIKSHQRNNNKSMAAAATPSNDDTTDSSSISSTNDYRLRREKNNEAVRKSRQKNRIKILECQQQVNELRQEKTRLNQRLEHLQSELGTLKSLVRHCFEESSSNQPTLPVDPSAIPTSTLFKLIRNEPSFQTSSSATNKYTQEDKFYINALLSVMSNSQQNKSWQQQSPLTPPSSNQ